MTEEALALGDCLQDAASMSIFQELSITESSEASYLTSRSKRVVDLVGAGLLLALVLPLVLAVALVIRATSRGEALFRQRRCGLNRSTFIVYKFRSMRAAGDAPFRQAVRGDPRVTWIGRLIRRTSIDEIPQLINVLKGEMSLVGPRPHVVELDERYAPEIVGYNTRFQARPGMTGLAQVSGARGGTPTIDHMRRRIDFDLYYVRHATLALDLKILARTAKELLLAFSDENAF